MDKTGFRLATGAFALILLGAGCGSTTGSTTSGTTSDAGCGPMSVTADGTQFDQLLTNGFAYTQKSGGDTTEIVQMYNNPDVTCTDVLGGRTVVEPEEVMFGAAAKAQAGVLVEEEFKFGKTSLLNEPSAVGDRISICVQPTTVNPSSGKFAGRTVVMSGKFTGTYCGEKAY